MLGNPLEGVQRQHELQRRLLLQEQRQANISSDNRFRSTLLWSRPQSDHHRLRAHLQEEAVSPYVRLAPIQTSN